MKNTLKSAVQSATSLSKETPTVPIDQLPQDLAAMLIDQKCEKHTDGTGWEIIGYDIGQDTRYPITRDGKKVRANATQYLTNQPMIDISDANWDVVERVPRATLRRDPVTKTSWYAIIIGNAVSVESWLKDRGYKTASAGSASYVSIREATAEELAKSPTAE